MRKGVVTSIAVSLAVILVVIAAIFVQSLDVKTTDRAGLEELQDYMTGFICEDGYSDILVDYHENNLEDHCKNFVSKYDDLILTMHVEDTESYLANHYYDIVQRYADFYNANILNNTIKFNKNKPENHVVFGGGAFAEQSEVFKLSADARKYIRDHYEQYMMLNQK